MPRHPRPTVPAWAAPWIGSFTLSLRAAGRSPRTVEMYADVIGWFAGNLPADITDWPDVTVDHVRRWFVHLQDQGYARSYVNNAGRCLQAYWKWWSIEEDQPNIFGARLQPPLPPKPGSQPPPVIAATQLAALLKDAEKGRDFESRRDAAIIRLFAATGGRLAELAHLQVDALNVQDRQATVTGKGRKTRTVRYDHTAALALDRYLRVRSRHKAVVELGLTALWIGTRRRVGMTPSGIRQVIERRAARVGLRVWPHLFRHTFAHNWLDRGGAEGDLMELAGWESSQMLRHYGASARGARARRAYDRVMGEMPG